MALKQCYLPESESESFFPAPTDEKYQIAFSQWLIFCINKAMGYCKYTFELPSSLEYRNYFGTISIFSTS